MDPEDELKNNPDALHTEENLFDTLANGNEFDDDDDDELIPNESFDSFVEEEENEEEENDDDDDIHYEEEENDDDEAENEEELNEKDLELFNKKLGTNYKTIDDLKKSLNTQEQESEIQKEEKEYTLLTNRISLFDKYIGMSNENLIRNQLISEASQDKKDINDETVLDEIEEKIQGLVDLNQLDSYADTLRSNLQTQKDKTQNAIDKIETKRTESVQAVARKNKDDLQNALTDIFSKQEFLGITISKEDILDVYKDITTNKFFDRINNNQEMIAKVAMFLKKEEELQKLGKRPTHSDNTKTAFEALAGKGKVARRSITQANGSASSGNANDNLNAWLK